MPTEQTQTVLDLRNEGHSIRDIAQTLGISKTSVERILNADKAATATERDTKPRYHQNRDHHNPELGKLEIEANKEIELKRLSLQERDQEISLEKARAERLRQENEIRELDLKFARMESEERRAEDNVEMRKNLLLSKYNKLIRELLKNCQGATWTEDEAKNYNDRALKLLKKVERFCADQHIDEEELAIYQNLNKLVKFMDKQIEEELDGGFFGSPTLELDFDKAEVKKWRAMLLSYFDDEFYEEEENDEDDDEDDEEDDDQDEEDEDEEDEEPEPVKPKKRKK